MSAPAETADAAEAAYRARLERHRARIFAIRILAARPRFFLALAAGVVAGFFTPDSLSVVSRSLIGWNVATICYLGLVLLSTRDSNRHRIRLESQLLDDGRFFVLIFSAIAAIAGIGAIVAELSVAKDLHGFDKAGHLLLAGGTIVASWLFIHMVFALHYAHEYYLERRITGADPTVDSAVTDLDGDGDIDEDDVALAGHDVNDPRGGLIFPDTKEPTYLDFVYFAYTIGVASQTADIEISSRPMRAVVLAHSIMSFFFNTTILALTINLAAGLF